MVKDAARIEIRQADTHLEAVFVSPQESPRSLHETARGRDFDSPISGLERVACSRTASALLNAEGDPVLLGRFGH